MQERMCECIFLGAVLPVYCLTARCGECDVMVEVCACCELIRSRKSACLVCCTGPVGLCCAMVIALAIGWQGRGSGLDSCMMLTHTGW